MATSAVTFEATLSLNSAGTRGEYCFFFRPSSNISGKLCYVEAKYFHLVQTKGDGTLVTPNNANTFLLHADWAQIQNTWTSDTSEQPAVPLATLSHGSFATESFPVLVQIPDGPHNVLFHVRRLDGGAVTPEPSTDTVKMVVGLTVVQANSRMAPIA